MISINIVTIKKTLNLTVINNNARPWKVILSYEMNITLLIIVDHRKPELSIFFRELSWFEEIHNVSGG